MACSLIIIISFLPFKLTLSIIKIQKKKSLVVSRGLEWERSQWKPLHSLILLKHLSYHSLALAIISHLNYYKCPLNYFQLLHWSLPSPFPHTVAQVVFLKQKFTYGIPWLETHHSSLVVFKIKSRATSRVSWRIYPCKFSIFCLLTPSTSNLISSSSTCKHTHISAF